MSTATCVPVIETLEAVRAPGRTRAVTSRRSEDADEFLDCCQAGRTLQKD